MKVAQINCIKIPENALSLQTFAKINPAI